MEYLDFEVEIRSTPAGHEILVQSGATEEGRRPFALPFNDLEIENFVLKMGQTGRGAARRRLAHHARRQGLRRQALPGRFPRRHLLRAALGAAGGGAARCRTANPA